MIKMKCPKCGSFAIKGRVDYGLITGHCKDCKHNFVLRNYNFSNRKKIYATIPILDLCIQASEDNEDLILYKKDNMHYLLDTAIYDTNSDKDKYKYFSFINEKREDISVYVIKALFKVAKKNKKNLILIADKSYKSKYEYTNFYYVEDDDLFWDRLQEMINYRKIEDVCIACYDMDKEKFDNGYNPIHTIFLSNKTTPNIFSSKIFSLLDDDRKE